MSNAKQTLKNFAKTAFKFLHPYSYISLCGSRYTQYDLMQMDSRYRQMHKMHSKVHAGLIREMKERQFANVLEVACGTGWNIPIFRDNDIQYYGLDVSETAIAVAMTKYPENRYFNLGICESGIFKDEIFDVVYSSSMLEHIGYYKEAISAMLRLAKKSVWILFFEGLSNDDDNQIAFHPYTENQINGVDKDIFGRKVVLQDHIHEEQKGWYWNRYSKRKILELFDESKYHVEILDKSNCPYIDEETLLIVNKV